MITEQAIVTRCHGKRVELQVQRQSACGDCELSRGCGTGALGRLLGHRAKPIIIDNEHDLKAGDSVILGLSEQALVKASLLIYGLPLAAMILAGLLAFTLLAAAEGFVLLASAVGFFAGLKLASLLVKFSLLSQFTPNIIEICVNPKTH